MKGLAEMLFVMCVMPQVYGNDRSCDGTVSESNPEVACEGENIYLKCPKKRPWIEIQSAWFGRNQLESHVCPRNRTHVKHNARLPGSKFCRQDVLDKVSNLCTDENESCQFSVNRKIFNNPCPEVIRGYLVVIYRCMCTRRFPRNQQPSTTTCISRSSFTTSAKHAPTQALAMIVSTMSQNVINTVHHHPSKSSTTHGPSRSQSSPASPTSHVSPTTTTSVTDVVPGSIPNPKRRKTTMNLRRKVFQVLLELVVVYHETYANNPLMSLAWCFLGILFGFVIMTTILLFYYLRGRKLKDKGLTRVSELEDNDAEASSPTIATQNSPQDSSEGRRESVGKTGGNSSECNSSSSASNRNTLVFTNPLWIGLQIVGKTDNSARENTKEDEHQQSQETADTAESAPRNCSEPTKTTNTQPHETSCAHANQSETGEARDRNNNEKPMKLLVSKRDRKTAERDITSEMPVGIPSSRVSVDTLLVRGDEKSSDTRHEEPDIYEDMEGALLKLKSRGGMGEYHTTNRLLAKFGLDVQDGTLSERYVRLRPSDTAFSSPALHNTLSNTETFHTGSSNRRDGKRNLGNVHACTANRQANNGGPNNSELYQQTWPSRSLSLDSSFPSVTSTFTETPSYTDTMAKRGNNEKEVRASEVNKEATSPVAIQQTSANTADCNHWSRSSRENDTSVAPQISFEETNDRKHSEGLQSGKRKSRKSPIESRASSGYYSNNPSPSQEHSFGFVNTQNMLNKETEVARKQQQRKGTNLNNKQKQHDFLRANCNGRVNAKDDLPPLPPIPLLLPPPSFLPHLPHVGSQCRQSRKSPSSMKKVHFEPKMV